MLSKFSHSKSESSVPGSPNHVSGSMSVSLILVSSVRVSCFAVVPSSSSSPRSSALAVGLNDCTASDKSDASIVCPDSVADSSTASSSSPPPPATARASFSMTLCVSLSIDVLSSKLATSVARVIAI